MNLTAADRDRLVEKVLNTHKYRHTGLNPQTVLDLIEQEAPQQSSEKALYKAVRRKLHNIVAPYLGDPDYAALSRRFSALESPTLDSPELRAICLDALSAHASTAERIPSQSEFYDRLFAATGTPANILDLGCALHPLAFPWMDLPPSTAYHAYDIVQPRVDFINHFFETVSLAPLAENRDILVDPPQIQADLGIFFKEAHRFEKRQPGCNRDFWASLNVKTLAVSLPTQNLSGTHSLLDQHRQLVEASTAPGKIREELIFEKEVVFLIDHPGRAA
jgi:16S rRNA (guanine(1405)-N(7))-methyltransferase